MNTSQDTRSQSAAPHPEHSTAEFSPRNLLVICGTLGVVIFLVWAWLWLHRKQDVVRLVERHDGDVIINQFRRSTPKWLKPVEKAVGPFPVFDRISNVEIISPDLTDDDLKAFEETDIGESLLLSSPKISDDGLKYLTHQHGLTTLTLHSDQITDEGMRHLGKLQFLEYLHIYSTKIDGSGLRYLAGCKGLSGAIFVCPSLKDENLKYLSKMPLKGLGLDGTRITDRGLKLISNMSLTSLGLAGTRITDKGLSYLHSMKTLRHLSINGTKVTKAGIRRLKQALPKLELDDEELPVKPPRYSLAIAAEEARKMREKRARKSK